MAFSRISRSSNIPAKTTPKSSKSSPKSRLNPPESLPKPSPNEHFRGFCYVKKSKMSTRKVQKPFVQKEPTFCSRFAVHLDAQTLKNRSRNHEKSLLKKGLFSNSIFWSFGYGFRKVFGMFFGTQMHAKSEQAICAKS